MLEHVSNPARCLTEAVRVARDRVVVTVPWANHEGKDPFYAKDKLRWEPHGLPEGCHAMHLEMFQALISPWSALYRVRAEETGNLSPPGWGAVIFKAGV